MTDPLRRNRVTVTGRADAPRTMLLAHGFGCDHTMWSRIVPAFEQDFRIVLMDYVGAGGTDPRDYNPVRYASLAGYAQDVLDVLAALGLRDVVFVGHSVSAMVGVLAAIEAPARFSELVLIGPNPCYVDDGDYIGGFSRAEVDGLLEMIENDYAAWARALAPVIMGDAQPPALASELESSFCRTDPAIAQRFARATFLSDNRADLGRAATPALVLQCSRDAIAPDAVGEFVHRSLRGSTLVKLAATGHCPHVSAPAETVAAIRAYLDARRPARQARAA